MKRNSAPLPAIVCALLAVMPFGMVGCGGDKPGSGDLTNPSANTTANQNLAGLTRRLERVEHRLAEQAKTHTAERQLMIKALEASTDRLDTVLGALLSGKIKPAKKPAASRVANPPPVDTEVSENRIDKGKVARATPDPKTNSKANSKANTEAGPEPHDSATANQANPESPFFGDIDTAQVLVVFLTVSLLLLVVVVVFFPGKLRGSIPQVEYAAIEEEAIAGLQVDPDVRDTSVVTARGQDLVGPRPSAFTPSPPAKATPPAAVDRGSPGENEPHSHSEDHPVRHELAIRVGDPDDITGLAEVLDTFLSTEPYILNEPAPQVALADDELHLRFFALPTLTATEHALLDDAVRRLTPHRPESPGAPGAPGAPESRRSAAS